MQTKFLMVSHSNLGAPEQRQKRMPPVLLLYFIHCFYFLLGPCVHWRGACSMQHCPAFSPRGDKDARVMLLFTGLGFFLAVISLRDCCWKLGWFVPCKGPGPKKKKSSIYQLHPKRNAYSSWASIIESDVVHFPVMVQSRMFKCWVCCWFSNLPCS